MTSSCCPCHERCLISRAAAQPGAAAEGEDAGRKPGAVRKGVDGSACFVLAVIDPCLHILRI